MCISGYQNIHTRGQWYYVTLAYTLDNTQKAINNKIRLLSLGNERNTKVSVCVRESQSPESANVRSHQHTLPTQPPSQRTSPWTVRDVSQGKANDWRRGEMHFRDACSSASLSPLWELTKECTYNLCTSVDVHYFQRNCISLGPCPQ